MPLRGICHAFVETEVKGFKKGLFLCDFPDNIIALR